MRIEDLDPARSKQFYADGVFRSLEALGFEWDNQPVYQSSRTEAYQEAYQELDRKGLLYPCFCTRADLHSANAPHFGEEVLYQGTCRTLTKLEQEANAKRRSPATRIAVPDEPFSFNDLFQGLQSFNLTECSGDFIIQRSDGVFAYQLAVTVDDAWMGCNFGGPRQGLAHLNTTPNVSAEMPRICNANIWARSATRGF